MPKAPAAAGGRQPLRHGVCLYGQIAYGLTIRATALRGTTLAGSPVFYLIAKGAQGPVFRRWPTSLSASFLVGLGESRKLADVCNAPSSIFRRSLIPGIGTLSQRLGSVVALNNNGGGSHPPERGFRPILQNGQRFTAAGTSRFFLSLARVRTVTYGSPKRADPRRRPSTMIPGQLRAFLVEFGFPGA